jgi:hypothetical protein
MYPPVTNAGAPIEVFIGMAPPLATMYAGIDPKIG